MKRLIQFGIYLMAAVSHLWLILMLAMDTAFGGVDEHSLSFLFKFSGLIASMVLTAIGASALLAARKIPTVLLLSGPIVSCLMLLFLGFGTFRQSAGVAMLVLPQASLSLAALFTGIVAAKAKAPTGEIPWPQ
jgi:hypothetical protein